MRLSKHLARAGAMAAALLALLGCDPQRISELEEGLSTEADVRDRFGVPDNVWDDGGGARTLEYNRQPAGQRNYMITIGPDGKMSALRQVLTPENFARITPGMDMQEVRRRLGKPAKVTPYALSGETHHDWRFLEPPTTPLVFTVVTTDGRTVARTMVGPDMDAPENKGGR
ncbi:outer membrane protein assembly factor BamE [Rhodococcus sp. SRB_17]|nr:outer membrane protein assembly factor BamE [Rhodococcus sp. SRB_17]